jgi:hypothetical protein
MADAHGSFEVASWKEETYEDRDGHGKLTRASVTQTFKGDVQGEGAAEWLMAYRADGTAHFVGLQRVTGAIADRRGSFVLETIGDFDGTMARWKASVVPGSGTDQLSGLAGEGSFGAPHGSIASFELSYSLE